MTITFCGHSDLYDKGEVEQWLFKITGDLIQKGAKTFYLGGYGSFDNLAKSVLLKHKRGYPNLEIVLVVPYINHTMLTDGYDGTLYPPLERVPPRFAIVKRNEWMVQQADIVIAYVTHGYGGAATTLKYANRKKKIAINYPDTEVIL